MLRFILSPLATRSGCLYGTARNPILVRTTFDYRKAWNQACLRDDLEGLREAEEVAKDLRSEPDVDFDEDDLPDFDPPAPPTAPSSAPYDDDDDDDDDHIPDLDTDSEEYDSDDDAAPFHGNIILPTPINKSPLANCSHHSPPSSSSFSTELSDLSSTASKKRRHRGSGARAGSRVRKDAKKHEEVRERRLDGELPVHTDGYVRRYVQSQYISRDFSVLD